MTIKRKASMKKSENVIIIGASGHGKVIADIVIMSGDYLLDCLGDIPSNSIDIMRYPTFGTINIQNKWSG